jgi:hypothetical protein
LDRIPVDKAGTPVIAPTRAAGEASDDTPIVIAATKLLVVASTVDAEGLTTEDLVIFALDQV